MLRTQVSEYGNPTHKDLSKEPSKEPFKGILNRNPFKILKGTLKRNPFKRNPFKEPFKGTLQGDSSKEPFNGTP